MSGDMPRLLLVEQYFFPEGWGGAEIPRDIAVGLREAGFEVDVLCSKDQYAPVTEQAPRDPASFGIRILRVPRIFPGPVHRLKLVRIVWFCLCALPRLLLHRGVDLYITQTNPLLIVPTVAIASALRRKPFVIIAQDLYPEALFASGLSGRHSLLGKALQRLFSWSYRRASRVVALGPYMQRRILEKGVHVQRIRTISNWATGDIRPPGAHANPLRAQWGLDDKLVVLYSGNMGIGHEFETFLHGVQRAAAAGANLAVVFIGGGVRLPEVRALVSDLDLTERVIFKDFVPASVLPLSLGLADIAVVTLRSGFEGIIVPSKLLGYMARAIPVLYVGPDSDVAEMIREAACGACCLPGAASAVADLLQRVANERALLRQWGENGRRRYAENFAREPALSRYVDVVREALACAPS
jgi:colanic acid biosynthesis glycosyl transferase WcaI